MGEMTTCPVCDRRVGVLLWEGWCVRCDAVYSAEVLAPLADYYAGLAARGVVV